MPVKEKTDSLSTHEVFNQVPLLENYNLYEVDPLLKDMSLPDDARQRLSDFGARLGSADYIRAGALANEYPPVFPTC